jgi:hypothetical protein
LNFQAFDRFARSDDFNQFTIANIFPTFNLFLLKQVMSSE